ncbi:hypothetical protein N7495_004846 [Penicillium taxi]|uniref:uncharacterized protein n=1 Tax=Penicillium taxi TaxID=168475 RepID=UPI0025453A11|nr:uncharacterized protein N7495_004846 [Penicillium taxi]KAJ5900102.1 hypothetical protein N7495_004846 [Penicillium taxi]
MPYGITADETAKYASEFAVVDDGAGRSQAIIIVTALFLALALISVAMRTYVRLRIVRAFSWDDGLMLLAMLFALGFGACTILGAKVGMGRKLIYFATKPHNFHKAMLSWWLGQIFYVFVCILSKISIILTLLRLTVVRSQILILYATASLAIIVGFIFLFFTIFQCSPVDYLWNQSLTQEKGTCLDVNLLIDIVYLYSVGCVVCDLIIGFLPVALIWNLRISRRKKAGVVGILGVGCTAGVALITRIPFIANLKDTEFLYNSYQIAICSNAEGSLSIVAGSLITLRPLVRVFRDKSDNTSTPNSYPLKGSYPLNNRANRSHRFSRMGEDDTVVESRPWTAANEQEFTNATVMGGQTHPATKNNSKEELNPNRIKRDIRVSVHESAQR